MNTSIKNVFLFCLASTLVLSACGGGSGGSTEATSGSGTISLNITDAPIDSASKVVVAFTGVSVKPENGAAFDIDFVDANGKPVVKSIDLLQQQGSHSEPILINHTLAAGHYDWMRLNVLASQHSSDSYIELDNGLQHSLYVPSGDETGLKLNRGFDITSGGAVTFTIDFDLRKSIVVPGNNSQDYKLRPSLRIVNNTTVGHISGSIGSVTLTDASCAGHTDYAVYVFTGADVTPDDVDNDGVEPVATALVSTTYEYAVGFLEQGTYTIAFTCEAADDDNEADETIDFIGTTNVTVTAGATTTYNFN
ncbi:MAG: DUF4382 domain-containing protein [Gammaproteobacteria bacterium]|nr:DUF4382 domain-containing protein [Gammaproteobacteria bacterium]